MREKVPMSTSCLSRENCEKTFGAVLDEGKDLVYIGFSSALSASYSIASGVLDELKVKYPDRKIYCCDSRSASLGQGRLVISAAEKRENGQGAAEVFDWVEANKLRLCHVFTVETLSYLYRGGRVKKTAYLLANTLNIKPVMFVDDEGRLTPSDKVFGRKKSLNALAQRCADTIVDPQNQTIYISHGDCIDDVDYLIARLKEHFPVVDPVINYVDLVIGTHSGPGTVALFYYGEERAAKKRLSPARRIAAGL
jgi:DegV family protein with EDD domain